MKQIFAILILILIYPFPSNAGESVILLHGLIRNSNSMMKIESALQDEGYHTISINYPSTKYDIETLADKTISEALTQCPDSSTRIHFVTHSMGGIMLRQYLHEHKIENLGRVVMLAPPNHGSQIVDHLKRYPCFGWINGPAGSQLGTDEHSLPNRLGSVSFEVGIIAGNRAIIPFFCCMLPNADDGIVTVESTKLDGMTDHITLPVTHTFMPQNITVVQQTIHFLQHGRFDHEGRIPDPYPAFSCNVKRLQSFSN